MQVHNGMRPQDVVVLLKFALFREYFSLPDLARGIGISVSETSKSLQRSRYSGLITLENKVALKSFLEFLRFGLPFVFPARPGAPTRGVPTALSHPLIRDEFVVAETFVWPAAEGVVRGTAIAPLYEALPRFIPADVNLYYALALVDVLRIGRSREKAYAYEMLTQLLSLERTPT